MSLRFNNQVLLLDIWSNFPSSILIFVFYVARHCDFHHAVWTQDHLDVFLALFGFDAKKCIHSACETIAVFFGAGLRLLHECSWPTKHGSIETLKRVHGLLLFHGRKWIHKRCIVVLFRHIIKVKFILRWLLTHIIAQFGVFNAATSIFWFWLWGRWYGGFTRILTWDCIHLSRRRLDCLALAAYLSHFILTKWYKTLFIIISCFNQK